MKNNVVRDEEILDNTLKWTGKAFYGNSTDLGYIPEELQQYFIMKNGNREFAIGLIELLKCMVLAEECGDLPSHSAEWWKIVRKRYELEIIQSQPGQVLPSQDK